jgi:hypothetical protein
VLITLSWREVVEEALNQQEVVVALVDFVLAQDLV